MGCTGTSGLIVKSALHESSLLILDKVVKLPTGMQSLHIAKWRVSKLPMLQQQLPFCAHWGPLKQC